MLINAVECKECGTIVYSRTEDDVRECDCGRVIVSGGLGYFKYDVFADPRYELKKIDVKTTPNELYNDWYNMEDNFGVIRNVNPSEDEEHVQVYNV